MISLDGNFWGGQNPIRLAQLCVYAYTCVCVCAYICVYTRASVGIYEVYMRISVRISVCIYVYLSFEAKIVVMKQK